MWISSLRACSIVAQPIILSSTGSRWSRQCSRNAGLNLASAEIWPIENPEADASHKFASYTVPEGLIPIPDVLHIPSIENRLARDTRSNLDRHVCTPTFWGDHGSRHRQRGERSGDRGHTGLPVMSTKKAQVLEGPAVLLPMSETRWAMETDRRM